jgi:hypothetical protein
VRRQLDIAGAAFHVGEVGAACAALRVLRPQDFAEPAAADDLLIRLRRHRDGPEVRGIAVAELLRMGREVVVAREASPRREAPEPDRSDEQVPDESVSRDAGGARKAVDYGPETA